MSLPLIWIEPWSSIKAPETAFIIVLLPAPFEPMTTAKSPRFRLSVSPSSATVSSGMPLKNTRRASLICNMVFSDPNLGGASPPRIGRLYQRLLDDAAATVKAGRDRQAQRIHR